MTSVERARKFIQAKGKAIALTIVPLATLTIVGTQSARATAIPGLSFDTTGGGCIVTAVGSASQGLFAQSNSCTDSVIAGAQNGIQNALKMTGNASANTGLAEGLEGSFSQPTSSGGLQFQMTGTATGSDTAVIPLNWDFNVTDTNSGATSGAYQLTFSFTGAGAPATRIESGNLVYTACSVNSSSVCSSATGSDSVAFGGAITGYTITLSATVNSAGGTFTLYVPPNSVDVNSPAPEPGSMALGVTGLLGLMFARFRRRKV